MNMPGPFDLLPWFKDPFIITVKIGFFSIIFSLLMAFVAGLLRLSPSRTVRWTTRVYVEIFRGSSLLVQLFWLYFVFPYAGIRLDPLSTAILALSLNGGAYGSEIVRGAILAVPKGQREAATALNLPPVWAYISVIIPQALRIMIPPFGNLAVEVLKGTALVSLITITDLVKKALQLDTTTFRTFEIFFLLLLIYFVMGQVLVAVTHGVEKIANRGVDRGSVA